jgi:hypothetical protein
MRDRRTWLGGFVLVAAAAIAVALIAGVGRGGGGDHEGKGGDPDRDVAGARIAAFHGKTVKQVTGQAVAAPTGFDSERLWSTGDDWEPAIAFDPSPGSSYVYQMTTRYGGPKACASCSDPAIIFRSSSNGGSTWGADSYICACKNVKAQNDPQIAVANDGTLYGAWLNDYQPGVVFSKSTNHGVTWSTPKSVEGKSLSFSDKPILTISPTGKDVYIAFNSSDSYVVASHDFGATWGTRVKTNSDGLYWFAEGGAVAPNGNVYFSESAENQTATGQVKLAVLRSTDGGTSFTTTFIDTSEQQPACTSAGCTNDFLGPQANLSIDSAGKLMVAYSLGTVAGGPKGLYVRTSTDGVTWSARQQLNGLGDNGFPVVSHGSTAGDFRVAWQDNRNGANAYNTWYTRTTNGGSTWSTQVRLSDQGSGAPYKTSAGYAFPYGDYFEMATAASGVNYVIWGEGISYTGPGGTWYTKGQ